MVFIKAGLHAHEQSHSSDSPIIPRILNASTCKGHNSRHLPTTAVKGTRSNPRQQQTTRSNNPKPAIPAATAVPYSAQTRPLNGNKSNIEGRTDNEKLNALIMQERRSGVVGSEHQLVDHQERLSGSDGRHKDHGVDSHSHQAEHRSRREQAAQSSSVSGPQDMLNIFQARADAAVVASRDCPSFTDRKSHVALMVLDLPVYLLAFKSLVRDDTAVMQHGSRRFAGDRREIGPKSEAKLPPNRYVGRSKKFGPGGK